MRKRREERKLNLFFKIGIVISSIFALITILFLYKLFQLNVLPIKYLILVSFGVILVDGTIIFLLIKKSIKLGFKIVALVFVILISLLNIFGYFYLGRSHKFLKKITAVSEIKTDNYVVVVLNDSGINNLDELKNKKVSYVKTVGNSHEAMEKLKESVEIISSNVTDTGELISGLVNKSLTSILISESIFEMYKEDYKVGESKLEDVTRVIHTIKLKVKEKQIVKEVDVTQDTFVVYISGIDTYGDITTVSRSDVNIVGIVNPKTHQVLLISIPRDYYVKLHGIETDMRDKLTHAGMYGIETSVGTIEDLLDIDINYYVKVNFTSVVDIVNALGGIEVNSKYAFWSTNKKYYYRKGINKLNGDQALQFARNRKSFSGGDRARGQNQQLVISAIIKKVATPAILTKYDSILSAIEGKFQTNVSADNISKLLKMQLDSMPNWEVKSISLDGYDSENYSYSYPKSAGNAINYVMEPNLDTIKRAQELIKDIKGNLLLDMTDENKTYQTINKSANVKSSSSKSNSSKSKSNSSSSNSSLKSNSSSNSSVSNYPVSSSTISSSNSSVSSSSLSKSSIKSSSSSSSSVKSSSSSSSIKSSSSSSPITSSSSSN